VLATGRGLRCLTLQLRNSVVKGVFSFPYGGFLSGMLATVQRSAKEVLNVSIFLTDYQILANLERRCKYVCIQENWSKVPFSRGHFCKLGFSRQNNKTDHDLLFIIIFAPLVAKLLTMQAYNINLQSCTVFRNNPGKSIKIIKIILILS